MSNERLDKYILGDMSPEEAAEFEADLDRNEELRDALHRAQGTLEAIRIYQQEQGRAYLRAHRAKKKGRTQTIRWGITIAALIMASGIGIWWYLSKSDQAESKAPKPAAQASSETAALLKMACEEIQFTQAPDSRNTAPKDSPTDSPEIQAFTSICEQQLPASPDRIRGWISTLETQTLELPNSSLQGTRYYLLALLYLELGEKEQAKAALQKDSTFMQGKVAELLKSLE